MSIYVVDKIAECVQYAGDKLLPILSAYDANITGINYMYGPPKEMINTLTDWTKLNGKDKDKYPVVMLFQSFVETYTLGVVDAANVRIIIARRNSDPKLKAPQRYENNFKPVLYPVYEELMRQLAIESNNFAFVDHIKTDWPFWGGDDQQAANPFGDKVDIIEIKINSLTFLKDTPCQTL